MAYVMVVAPHALKGLLLILQLLDDDLLPRFHLLHVDLAAKMHDHAEADDERGCQEQRHGADLHEIYVIIVIQDLP